MSRTVLICGIVLLISPAALPAQHRGGRGGGGKSAPTGVSDTETDQSKEFKHAAAVQARPEQVTQFQQLTTSERTARKRAQDVVEHAENATQPDLFHSTKSLSDALEETQSENQQFLQSFSDSQKSGLKDLLKKLGKASSEVTKEDKGLSRQLERSKVDEKQIAEVVKRLDKALADLQATHAAMGTEMGIEGAGNSL